MKPALIALLVLPLMSATAQGEFDPKGAITCHSQSGKKVLINDEFTGQGRALVSGSSRSYYAGYFAGAHGASLLITTGLRSITPTYTIRLDLAGAELTSRQEGPDLVHYRYLPAEFVTTSLWSGDQVEAGKCLQAVK